MLSDRSGEKTKSLFHFEEDAKTGIITINNPPVNAISTKLRKQLAQKIEELESDTEIWSLIIIGNGEKSFAAGADIPSLLALDQQSGLKRVKEIRAFLHSINQLEKPVIAAINGLCLGSGLELALACDIRIAAEHARLGLPEVNLGLIPGAGGTQRLPRAVGSGWANYLLFTGDFITADKAKDIGLVQEVTPYSKLRSKALKIAQKINSKAPLAVRAAKKASREGLQVPLEKGLDLENHLFSKICITEDKTEGIKAFLEKRKSQFTGT